MQRKRREDAQVTQSTDTNFHSTQRKYIVDTHAVYMEHRTHRRHAGDTQEKKKERYRNT